MEITWFGHATVRIFSFGQTLLFDPVRANARLATTYKPDSEPKASLVLITSERGDHCEPDTVRLAAEKQATIVAPKKAMKGLLRTRRRDAQFAIAKNDETLKINDHLKVRCLSTIDGYEPGISYAVEAAENVLFLGDSLMNKEAWAYLAHDFRPNVVIFPPYLALKDKEPAARFKEWISTLGPVSLIPIHYHTSPHSDPSYFVEHEKIADTVPKGARLELLSNRPLVAKETKRMRRRM